MCALKSEQELASSLCLLPKDTYNSSTKLQVLRFTKGLLFNVLNVKTLSSVKNMPLKHHVMKCQVVSTPEGT